MRNKKIIASLTALLFTMQTGFATDITSVSGVNGVYNINPETVKGDAGFRHYENFYLSESDIANLIMQYGTKDLSTFINMVDNKVNIQGILNTVRNGEFANGNAVFISPNGMVVGASGVLNVGALSVLTPTDSTYKKILQDPLSTNLSELENESNGEILVRGKILSRGDVTLNGSSVILPETSVIMAGVQGNTIVTSQSEASNLLFNSLVNTQNLDTSSKDLTVVDGNIVIKTTNSDGMINSRGAIYNLANGDTQLINTNGSGGIKVTGTIQNTNGDLILDNNAGKTLIKGSLTNNNGTLLISDNGEGIHINSGAAVTAESGSLKIKNNGENGLSIYGEVTGLDDNMVIENNNGNLYIAGDINYEGDGVFQILNNAGEGRTLIAKTATIDSSKDVYIRNKSEGGLFVNGQITAENNLTLDNRAGDLTINNTVSTNNGNLSLSNSGEKLSVATKGTVSGKGGNVVIRSTGTGGLLIYGTVENDGDITSISSSNGDMIINGTVDVTSGTLGIVNTGDSMLLTKASTINTNGKTNIINTGEGGMKAYGTITANDELNIINDNGQAYIDGSIEGNNTDINILSRKDSNGVYIKTTANITNLPQIEADKVGNITIEDTANAGGSGVIIKGTINGYNDVNITSENNNIYTSGTVNAANNVTYTGTADNGKVTFNKDAEVTADGEVDYVVENGSQVYFLPLYY